jgi:hypothetical protein
MKRTFYCSSHFLLIIRSVMEIIIRISYKLFVYLMYLGLILKEVINLQILQLKLVFKITIYFV